MPQAEALGNVFRTVMYPRYGPAGGGLLRLHSTYRHDLKIYSSDEGRVQTSAAAFTQGLLDLEGDSLTPILVRWGFRSRVGYISVIWVLALYVDMSFLVPHFLYLLVKLSRVSKFALYLFEQHASS